MLVHGFKAFDKNMKNCYGMQFEEGRIYKIDGKLCFGTKGNGIHFCKRMEDTLRYVDGMGSEIKIASVISLGDYKESADEYYGYYDMYVASELFVEHIFTREEIITYFLNSASCSVDRFLRGFKLEKKEVDLFKNKFMNDLEILKTILYYQEENLNTYSVDSKLLIKNMNIK